MQIAKRSDRTKFRNQILRPLLEDGLVEMTIPDKPKMIKHDLVILKQHDLIDTKGFGRGAVWYLKDTSERRIRNKDK